MTDPRSFASLLRAGLRDAAETAPGLAVEPLAHLDYERELALKNLAMRQFWAHHRLPLAPASILPSPKPRQYRTTTRRHVVCDRAGLRLAAHHAETARGAAQSPPSRLEPPEHTALYTALAKRLGAAHFRPLARALSYIIVRGSYTERSVLFNVAQLDGTIVRKLKLLAQALPELDPGVVSAFAFVDPTRSPYYLDHNPVPGGLKLKRLFGPETLRLTLAGRPYEYYPTGFTQVNESMVPAMLAAARDLLSPGGASEHLLDLYCGYGLFTHYLAASYAHALGVEAAPESIAAARRNARFHPPGVTVAFRLCRIEDGTFTRCLPAPDAHREVVLTDPPRQGMPPPAIAAVAGRAPAKVLQACCGIDELPGQVAAWGHCGYALQAAQPLDLFAGTAHLETLLLFTPDSTPA